jgi:hypothetical protein
MGSMSGKIYARTAIVCALLMFSLPWMGALGTARAGVRDEWNEDPNAHTEPWTLVGWSYHPDGPTYLALFARANGTGTQFRLDGQISKGTVKSVIEEDWWAYAQKFFVVIRVYTDDGDGWHMIEPDKSDPDSKPRFDDGEGQDVVHIEVKNEYAWSQGSQQFKDYDLGTHDVVWDENLRWTFWVGCGGNNFKYRSSNSIWSKTIQAWSDNFEGIAVACTLVSAALYFASMACAVSGVAAPLAPFLAAAGFVVDVFVVVGYIVHCSVELVKADCDYLMTALSGDGRLEREPRLLDPGDIKYDDDGKASTPDVPVYKSANKLVHIDSDNDPWIGTDSFEDDTTGAMPLDTGIMKGVCLATGGIRQIGAHFSIEPALLPEPPETITRIKEIHTEVVYSTEREKTINESWYSAYFDPARISHWANQMLSHNGQPLLLVRFCHLVDYETKLFGTSEPSGAPPWPSATQTFNGHWMVWGMNGNNPVEKTRHRDFDVQWRLPVDPDDNEIHVDIDALMELIEENTADRTWIDEDIPDMDEYIQEMPERDDFIVADPRLQALYRMLLEIEEQAGEATA